MFRITPIDEPASLTFQVEGQLTGSAVAELHRCWSEKTAGDRRVVRFDLTGVTQLDAAGKEFVAARYGEGAELVATGCWMKWVLAEVTRSPMVIRQAGAARG
jgi:hypothetical protein